MPCSLATFSDLAGSLAFDILTALTAVWDMSLNAIAAWSLIQFLKVASLRAILHWGDVDDEVPKMWEKKVSKAKWSSYWLRPNTTSRRSLITLIPLQSMMGYGKELTKTLLPTGVNSFVSSYQEYSTQLSLME
jgi:hypothetical protein